MDVKSCRRCRKLFNYVVGPHICPSCREELEKKFHEVKKYIEENPHSGIRDVSDACDIDTNQITTWIREERLQFSDEIAVGFGCERCGASIRSGRYCSKCKVEMTNSFNAAIKSSSAKKPETAEPSKGSSSARMRYLDN